MIVLYIMDIERNYCSVLSVRISIGIKRIFDVYNILYYIKTHYCAVLYSVVDV